MAGKDLGLDGCGQRAGHVQPTAGIDAPWFWHEASGYALSFADDAMPGTVLDPRLYIGFPCVDLATCPEFGRVVLKSNAYA